MIALDTGILVYARRRETPSHEKALAIVKRFAEGKELWGLPWPCIYEFLRVVTHPRVFNPPTGLDDALEGLESLLASPSLVLLGMVDRLPQSIGIDQRIHPTEGVGATHGLPEPAVEEARPRHEFQCVEAAQPGPEQGRHGFDDERRRDAGLRPPVGDAADDLLGEVEDLLGISDQAAKNG